ncbi:hypothetical protein [Streptomyces guryensis]|uniref:Uncharacterized protein n=1 Tax=Streptomyces guryensis TaxID=2886947 RepID=A0A9Q3VN46_9ACTN|nr:hypothetical protein [Streptomyces guryensis]MCD9874594.1 hypothetical protein [Streptomyces guryensis]
MGTVTAMPVQARAPGRSPSIPQSTARATPVTAARSAVEEVHGGAAADAGQGTPEQVGRVDGLGRHEEDGRSGEKQAAQLTEEVIVVKGARRDGSPPAKSTMP